MPTPTFAVWLYFFAVLISLFIVMALYSIRRRFLSAIWKVLRHGLALIAPMATRVALSIIRFVWLTPFEFLGKNIPGK